MSKYSDKDHKFNYGLKYRYNITLEKYNQMLESQNMVCAICKSEHSKSKINNLLFVDHCHKTNNIRGLLCSRCNNGLGMFNDDVNLLYSAIAYLSKYNNL